MSTLLSSFKIRGSGGAHSVVSVNSKTGAVVITKADILLSNVDNTSDLDKPISTLVQTALNNKVDKVTGKQLSTNDFTNTYKTQLDNFVTPTKESIGLGNVDNTSDLNKPISTLTLTALNNKVDKVIGKQLSTNDFTNTYKTQLDNFVIPTKESIGLGNVDNTSDLNKPLSTLTINALDQKVDKVVGKQLSTNDFTNEYKSFIDNYDGSGSGGGEPVTKESIGLGNVDNTSDLDKPISTAVQAELIALQNTLSSFEQLGPILDGLQVQVSNGVFEININGQDALYTIISNITQFIVIKPQPPKVARSIIYIVQGLTGGFTAVNFPSTWNWISSSTFQLPSSTNRITRMLFEVDPVGNVYVEPSIIEL